MHETNVLYGTGEVAKRLDIARWRLQYLIERGDLPGPSQNITGRRLFTEADIERLQRALIARNQHIDIESPATAS